jgi:hypothetical protein
VSARPYGHRTHARARHGWAELLRLVGAVRRLAFDDSLPASEALGSLSDEQLRPRRGGPLRLRSGRDVNGGPAGGIDAVRAKHKPRRGPVSGRLPIRRRLVAAPTTTAAWLGAQSCSSSSTLLLQRVGRYRYHGLVLLLVVGVAWQVLVIRAGVRQPIGEPVVRVVVRL